MERGSQLETAAGDHRVRTGGHQGARKIAVLELAAGDGLERCRHLGERAAPGVLVRNREVDAALAQRAAQRRPVDRDGVGRVDLQEDLVR